MSTSEPTCGSCGARVTAADIVCPRCGALLAAYASPAGAVDVTPESTEIPQVAPQEAPLPTAYTADVDIDLESTAPRPLFDTHVTIDELAAAADSDGSGVVTLVDTDPMTSAEPIISPDTDRPTVAAIERPPLPTPPPAPPVNDPGETDAYLRKLHEQAGYTASSASVSRPVETRGSEPGEPSRRTSGSTSSRNSRPAPAQRGGKRGSSTQGSTAPSSIPGVNPTALRSVFAFVVVMLWLAVVISVLGGNFNPGLIVIAIAMTWAMQRVGSVSARRPPTRRK